MNKTEEIINKAILGGWLQDKPVAGQPLEQIFMDPNFFKALGSALIIYLCVGDLKQGVTV